MEPKAGEDRTKDMHAVEFCAFPLPFILVKESPFGQK